MKNKRLDNLIANETSLSRKQATELIKKGELLVNGKVVLSASEKVDAENDEIVFCGRRLNCAEHVYIMMNKPKGVLSASSDKKAKTVIDLVPDELRRKGLFPAGRLDKDTTGFILLTDDGEFAHKILSPKNHIYKTYVARIRNPITDDEIKTLERGITLSDGTVFKKCKIKILNDEKNLIEIKICEGKFHQIKRMLQFVNNEVLVLERVKMGNLTIDNVLKPGECRLLTDEELKIIRDFDE
ncbi:MAG: rRNA pseudouridine synthase [Clostridia bacterium]|nr:rRNA pseudouridine synthase [Clostridia bacterium]